MGDLLAEFPRQADYATILRILTWFNAHEPKREKFEQGYHTLSLLWESLFPDPSLVAYEAEYAWLTRLWMYYRKKFYPLSERFETDPADGAKTRELIRKYVDVEDLKRNLPTYRIDVDFLTKLKDTPPDAKALDIEAMLAAELKIRLDEDEDFLPLSERLKHIILQKRQASLTGLALLAELENLTRDVVDLLEESKRPLAESIAKVAQDRSYGLDELDAQKISVRMIQKADELCFPGWEEQEHIEAELFREFTILLVTEFPATGLYNPTTEFVIRCIKLMRKARYKGQST
jgi:type I restriction enzyme R subunit